MVDGLLSAKAFDHLKVKTLYCKFKLKPLTKSTYKTPVDHLKTYQNATLHLIHWF